MSRATSNTAATRPTIGVVVPNRDDSQYLRRCLRSVVDQEVAPDELIVVDDKSTDDSVAVIRSLISGVAGAQLIENPLNMGTMGALNEGLGRARSDYVLFLASNDFAAPGLFARAKQCIARAGSPGLWSAMVWVVDEHDRLLRLQPSAVVALRDAFLTPERCIRLARRLGNWFIGTTVMFHRETLQQIGGFDLAYRGLADYIAALAIAGLRGAVYTPEPLGVMRQHAGGYLAKTLEDQSAVEAMISRLREQGPRLAPKLFTPDFVNRTADRFRFAVVRASAGRSMPDVAMRYEGMKRRMLDFVAQRVPSELRRLRLGLTYVILRPYDVLPALWYRLASVAIVHMRIHRAARPLISSGFRGSLPGE